MQLCRVHDRREGRRALRARGSIYSRMLGPLFSVLGSIHLRMPPALAPLLLAWIFPAGLSAQSPIHYTVRFTPDGAEAEVTATISAPVARIFMDSLQAQHLPQRWATFVRRLEVRSGSDPVEIRAGRPGEWLLGASRSPLTIRYAIDLAVADQPWPVGNEQSAQRFDDALYMVSRLLFIDADLSGPRTVRFEVPAGWRVSTPWKPTDASGLAFEAESSTDLLRNSMVIGRHASVRVERQGFELELALPGPARTGADAIRPVLERALDNYLRLFPGTPETRFLMTFFLAGADDGESYLRSAAFTSADPPRPEGLIVWGNFIAHELFHFWNGQRIVGAEARTVWRWMAEGFTEYYANVTLARTGAISRELFLGKVERHLGNYLFFMSSPAFTRMSLVEAGTNTGTFRFGVYDGGWTIALCLDGLIRERSGDRSSLDRLMTVLWGLAREQKPYTTADIDRLANELAGADLGGFVTRYVSGREIAPIRECLARYGLMGAFKPYAAEAFLSPNPTSSPVERMRFEGLLRAVP
jgi:predicted metalloprotease with PDZ domain